MDILFGIAFVVSFTGLMLAFISAKKVQTRLTALRAENERLRDAVIDCLSWMQCQCGNPYCGKCRATRKADAALAAKEE